jgi:hypothetical protein
MVNRRIRDEPANGEGKEKKLAERDFTLSRSCHFSPDPGTFDGCAKTQNKRFPLRIPPLPTKLVEFRLRVPCVFS